MKPRQKPCCHSALSKHEDKTLSAVTLLKGRSAFARAETLNRQSVINTFTTLMVEGPQIVMRVPISTTLSVGIWKYTVASLALRARKMKSLSCHRGIPPVLDGCRVRRERKNDVEPT